MHPQLTKQQRTTFLAKAKKACKCDMAPQQMPAPKQKTLMELVENKTKKIQEEHGHEEGLMEQEEDHNKERSRSIGSKGKGKVPVGGTGKEKMIRGKTTKGTTKGYPRYTMDQSPFPRSLFGNAISRFGLSMADAPATEMMVDVSKISIFRGISQ